MIPFFSHGGECLTDLRPKKGDHPIDLGLAWISAGFFGAIAGAIVISALCLIGLKLPTHY
jgi:hypothetical protein